MKEEKSIKINYILFIFAYFVINSSIYENVNANFLNFSFNSFMKNLYIFILFYEVMKIIVLFIDRFTTFKIITCIVSFKKKRLFNSPFYAFFAILISILLLYLLGTLPTI